MSLTEWQPNLYHATYASQQNIILSPMGSHHRRSIFTCPKFANVPLLLSWVDFDWGGQGWLQDGSTVQNSARQKNCQVYISQLCPCWDLRILHWWRAVLEFNDVCVGRTRCEVT